MSTEKMREEFEAVISDRMEKVDLTRSHEYPDIYECPFVSGCWFGWKESRAAIEVELPKPSESYGCMGEGMGEPDYSIAYEGAVEAIESLGLRVKS